MVWGNYGELPNDLKAGDLIDSIEEYAPLGDDYSLRADGYNIKAFVGEVFNFNLLKYDVWVMLAMIIFMGFSLASGLGVYWFVGALFSIVQTVIMQTLAAKKKNKK